MMDRRKLLAVALGAALVLPQLAMAGDLIDELDKDHSGSLDLNEVKTAAAKIFDELDKDHSGSLERKELGKRLTDADFKAADPDGSGNLSKAEFVALAEKLFHAADVGHDGTLSHADLKTPAGKALEELLED
jgi:Ca2+-binding EF-hand superfamily protein